MYQIMLVEDEALVRESMAQNTNWEKFGFAPPHVFENGRQAADHLETVLPDLLEHLGVSRSYFSTVFKEKTGQSFVEYLTNLRMEKAKEYLRETGLCTYEIADRIGFADPHYFSLTFRRRTGMTPKQYREAEK